MDKRIPMLTFTKKTVNINDLKPYDIYVEDIAHGLSNLCRYNGATKRFYSVAEHCVRLSMHVDKREKTEYNNNLMLACLLHDATEAYVGDIIYHLKHELPEFCVLENKVESVIFDKFGITPEIKSQVSKELHELDRRICVDEMYYLFDGHIDPIFYENKTIGLGESILNDPSDFLGWSPEKAKHNYKAALEIVLSNIKAKKG